MNVVVLLRRPLAVLLAFYIKYQVRLFPLLDKINTLKVARFM
jgi:hypothetical protein